MQQQPSDEAVIPNGGIRFGADDSNAYAGEVGYDTASGPIEYNTELVDDAEEEEDDQGRTHASHPSTIARRMVRFY
jgi:hypothetical protein